MFTHQQSRGGLRIGMAAMLALACAVTATSAQFQAAAPQGVGAPDVGAPQSADITAGAGSSIGTLIEANWLNLGHALPGGAGSPSFKGYGSITAGVPAKLTLHGAAPSALAVLFVSLESDPRPFKGGILVPAAPAFAAVLTTNSDGFIELVIPSWAHLPAGLNLVMQYAIADATAAQGASLSNALQTVTH